MSTKYLNTRQLMAAFGVSHMTMLAWRMGSATKEALPTVATEDRSVLFAPGKVKAWAKKHKVEAVAPQYLEPGVEAPKRPAAVAKKPAKKAVVKRSALSASHRVHKAHGGAKSPPKAKRAAALAA